MTLNQGTWLAEYGVVDLGFVEGPDLNLKDLGLGAAAWKWRDLQMIQDEFG